MTYDDDYLIFSTGKRVYANCGIVGMGPHLSVHEGSDGGICNADGALSDWHQGVAVLTPAERIELADHMIERWQAFRQRALEVKP